MSLDADDLAQFMDEDMPGYITATVSGTPVGVLFSNGYGSALGMAGSAPAILAQAADVSGVARGAAVTVDGTAYTVASIEPDGSGHTRLLLDKA